MAVEAQQQAALDAAQTLTRERRKLGEMEQAAQKLLNAEYRRVELRVFLYRLALTLPLLVLAGWLRGLPPSPTQRVLGARSWHLF